jgi:GMP synthase-like glutamine amidotransferase
MISVSVVLYECTFPHWVTQVIKDVQVNEADMTVFVAASRAISLAFRWRNHEDWTQLQFLYDTQCKALCRHVAVHSWLTDSVIFVPLPGVALIHEPFEIVDEAVLQSKYKMASQHNIFQAGLASLHLEVPPMIYKEAKYGLIMLQDYEPLVYFNEAHYCGYFLQPREHWAFYNIPNLPDTEALEQLEGLVITGGKYAAYDMEVPWMQSLHNFLRTVFQQYPRIKVLGICLGCQVTAAALGGVAIKDPKISFIHKLESIDTTEAARSELPDLPRTLWQAEVHQDCVSVLPPEASLYASSETCKVEMWGIPGRLLASQFHPEFSNYFILNHVTDKLLRTHQLSQEEAEAAKGTFTRPSTSVEVVAVMQRWLHSRECIK